MKMTKTQEANPLAEPIKSQGNRTILVTDSNRGSSLCVIRSLGRLGHRLIVADEHSNAVGNRSKYVYESLVYPSPKDSPTKFGDWALQLVSQQRIDLILPMTDETILPLARTRDSLEKYTRLGVANQSALEATLNKSKTMALAQRLGVPTPRTHVIESPEQLESVIDTLEFPAVAKPQVSRFVSSKNSIESLSVSYAFSPKDIRRIVEDANSRYAILVQEYHGGSGVGVELVARGGVPLVAFQHRRLAEVPLTGGASAWRTSESLCPELLGYSTKLVAALRWSGPIMIEFKVGDGARLMEINGRPWGSLPLSYASGVDIACHWVNAFSDSDLSLPTAPLLTPYKIGVRAYNPDLLISWFGRNLLQRGKKGSLPFPKRTQFFRVFFGALLFSRHDYFDSKDLAPLWAHAKNLLRKTFGKILKSVEPGTKSPK